MIEKKAGKGELMPSELEKLKITLIKHLKLLKVHGPVTDALEESGSLAGVVSVLQEMLGLNVWEVCWLLGNMETIGLWVPFHRPEGNELLNKLRESINHDLFKKKVEYVNKLLGKKKSLT